MLWFALVLPAVLLLAVLANWPFPELASRLQRVRRAALVLGLTTIIAVADRIDSGAQEEKLQSLLGSAQQVTNNLGQQSKSLTNLSADLGTASEDLKASLSRSNDAVEMLGLTYNSILSGRLQAAAQQEKTQAEFDQLLCGMETLLEMVTQAQKQIAAKTERFIRDTALVQDPDSMRFSDLTLRANAQVLLDQCREIGRAVHAYPDRKEAFSRLADELAQFGKKLERLERQPSGAKGASSSIAAIRLRAANRVHPSEWRHADGDPHATGPRGE